MTKGKIAVLALAVIIISGGAFWFYHQNKSNVQPVDPVATQTEPTQTESTKPAETDTPVAENTAITPDATQTHDASQPDAQVNADKVEDPHAVAPPVSQAVTPPVTQEKTQEVAQPATPTQKPSDTVVTKTHEFSEDEGVEGKNAKKMGSKSADKAAVKTATVAATPAPSNCFAAEYKHTKKNKNQDIEEFLDFSNAYPIAQKDYNASTVCVKVNGQPVKHKIVTSKGQIEALIGSVVGPESVIRVSYCTGKANCSEPCSTKSKRFMDDMMSDANQDQYFKDSLDVQAQVKELRTVASQSEELSRQSVIRSWDTIKQQDWFCKKGK
jgi:hypothetical protein